MIIWINGAFGAGKTQTAYELKERLPNSHIYDPEQIGFFLNKNLPKQMCNRDFQEHPVWRTLNYETLSYLSSNFEGVIIVPMTIVQASYYEEIIDQLKAAGIFVHHFVLSASKETLLKRLKSRGEKHNGWAANQIDRCMEGLSHPTFQGHIQTDNMTIEQVAEMIAKKIGIDLEDDKRSKAKKIIHKLKMRGLKI